MTVSLAPQFFLWANMSQYFVFCWNAFTKWASLGILCLGSLFPVLSHSFKTCGTHVYRVTRRRWASLLKRQKSLTFIREVPDSNLWQDTDYLHPCFLRLYRRMLTRYIEIGHGLLLFKSFPTFLSLIILLCPVSFGTNTVLVFSNRPPLPAHTYFAIHHSLIILPFPRSFETNTGIVRDFFVLQPFQFIVHCYTISSAPLNYCTNNFKWVTTTSFPHSFHHSLIITLSRPYKNSHIVP
jgi:hypothetical protein